MNSKMAASVTESRRRNFPFRKQAMPFLRDLENFRTVIEILHLLLEVFLL